MNLEQSFEIQEKLNSFTPINLSEMDAVQLMDRFDFKMLFHISKLDIILEKLKPLYKVLEVKNIRLSRYDNRYFDTPDFNFFLLHHNKKGNRLKVRYRQYTDSGDCFFEVKFKNNKGKTLKERISVNGIPDKLRSEEKELLKPFLNQQIIDQLMTAMDNSFYRITLVNNKQTDRLTLDINVQFNNGNNKSEMRQMVIAELKQEAHTLNSFMKSLFKDEKVYPVSISKYAIGCVLLNPKLKYNNFKEKILILNKFKYAVA